MSKVPYTINVNEYVCSVLEQMRNMDKLRDYSGLLAAVERVQFHASRMEEALYANASHKSKFERLCSEGTLSDAEFRNQCIELMQKIDPTWKPNKEHTGKAVGIHGMEYYE